MSDEVGCFRCHDEQHATKDGKTISQDCATCHSLLAQDEKDPAILKTILATEVARPCACRSRIDLRHERGR